MESKNHVDVSGVPRTVPGYETVGHRYSGGGSSAIHPCMTLFSEMRDAVPERVASVEQPFVVRTRDERATFKKEHSLLRTSQNSMCDEFFGSKMDDTKDMVHLVGHIFADAFARDTEIEGLRHSVTARFLVYFFNQWKGLQKEGSELLKPIEECADSVQQVQTTADEISAIAVKCNGRPALDKAADIEKLSRDIAKRISKLQEGTSYTVSGGWSGAPGHAMVYEFTKKNDGSGNYFIRVYNTGSGTESYHDLLYVDSKTKIRPLMQFDNVPAKELFFDDDGVLHQQFFQKLLEARIVPNNRVYPFGEDILEYDATYIYTIFLTRLGAYRTSLVDQDTAGFMTAQRSGTCSWKSLTAMVRSKMERNGYKYFKLMLKFHSLVSAFRLFSDELGNDEPDAAQKRVLLKKGAEKLLRSIAKDYEEDKLLSYDDAHTAFATAIDIIDRVEEQERRIVEKRCNEIRSLAVSDTKSQCIVRANAVKSLGVVEAPVYVVDATMPMPKSYDCTLSSSLKGILDDVVDLLNKESGFVSKKASRVPDAVMAQIEQLVGALPIPGAENEEMYWDTLPDDDISGVMHRMSELIDMYSWECLQGPLKTPRQANTVFALFAIIHALALRYDNGERGTQQLGTYGMCRPWEIFNNDRAIIYPDLDDMQRRGEIESYFHTQSSWKMAGLFDFYTQSYYFDKGQGSDISFYKKILSNKAVQNAVEQATLFTSVKETIPDGSQETHLIAALAIDDGGADGPLIRSGMEHIAYLKRAAALCHFISFSGGGKWDDKGASIGEATTRPEHRYHIVHASSTRNEGEKKDRLFVLHVFKNERYDAETGKEIRRIQDADRRKFLMRSDTMFPPLSEGVREFLIRFGEDSAVSVGRSEGAALICSDVENDPYKGLDARALIRTQCEPTLQLYQLLAHFTESMTMLSDPSMQTLFDTFFFKRRKMNEEGRRGIAVSLPESALRDPAFREQCQKFVDNGMSTFFTLQPNERPDVHTCLFFERFSQHIQHYLNYYDIANKEFHGVSSAFFDQWLKNEDLSNDEKSALNLHFIASYIGRKVNRLSEDDIVAVFSSWASHRTTSISRDHNIPWLEYAVSRYMYQIAPSLLTSLSLTQKGVVCSAILERSSIFVEKDISALHWLSVGDSRNLFKTTVEGEEWQVNLLAGAIYSPRGVIRAKAEIEWEHDEDYRRLFGGRKPNYIEDGSVVYFTDSERNQRMRVVRMRQGAVTYNGGDFAEGLQWYINNEWCQYCAPVSLKKSAIPFSLLAEHNHWKSSTGILIITDRTTNIPRYKVSVDGVINAVEVRDGNMRDISPSRRYSQYAPDTGGSKAVGSLTTFERGEYILVENDDMNVKGVSFPRYRARSGKLLQFTAIMGDHLQWGEDQRFVLSPKTGLLGNLDNYLSLVSRDGTKRKILVPRHMFAERRKKLSPTERIDIDDTVRSKREGWDTAPAREFDALHRGQYEYFDFTVGIDGTIEAPTPEGNMFLSYIFLQQGDYRKALTYLAKIEQSDRLYDITPDGSVARDRGLEILQWIVEFPEHNASDASLALHAAFKLISYAGRLGPEGARAVEFCREQCPRLYRCYIDGLGNVEAGVELPLDDEERLFHYSSLTHIEKEKEEFSRRYDFLTAKRYRSIEIHPSRQEVLERKPLGPLKNCYCDPGYNLHPHYKNPTGSLSFIKTYKGAGMISCAQILSHPFFKKNTSDDTQDYRFFWSRYHLATEGTDSDRTALLFELDTLEDKDLGWCNSDLISYLQFAAMTLDKAPHLPPMNSTNGSEPWKELVDWMVTLSRAYKIYRQSVDQIRAPVHVSAPYDRVPGIINAAMTRPGRMPSSPIGLGDSHAALAVTVVFQEENDAVYVRLGELFREHFDEIQREDLAQGREDPFTFKQEYVRDEERSFAGAIESEFAAFGKDFEKGRALRAGEKRYNKKEGIAGASLREGLRTMLIAQEAESVRLKDDILSLANTRSDDKHQRLIEQAQRDGRLIRDLEMKDLILLFLRGDREGFIAANFHLKSVDLGKLYGQIAYFLYLETQNQQISRIQKNAEKLEAERDPAARNYLTQEVASELIARRQYDLRQHPEFLVFEYYSNILMRDKQVALLGAMLEKDPSGNFNDVVIQLIMGGGKTSVLAAVAGMFIAKAGKLSTFVVPAALFESVRSNLTSTQRRCFNQELQTFDYGREDLTTDRLDEMFGRLQKAKELKQMVLIKAETLQSFELELISSIGELLEVKGATRVSEEIGRRVALLKKIVRLFRDDSVALVDEIDIVLRATHEVNFPSGAEQRVPRQRIKLMSEIYKALASEDLFIDTPAGTASLHDVVGLHENRQALIEKGQYKDLFGVVARHLVETYEPLLLNRDGQEILRASFVRYATGSMNPELENHIDEIGGSFDGNDAEDIAFLRRIRQLSKSTSEGDREAANLIALTKHLMTTLLSSALGRSGDRNYGRTYNVRDIPGKIVPYLAVGTPATTQFGYHYEAVAYHFQAALNGGIGVEQFRVYAEEQFKLAQYCAVRDKEPFAETDPATEFLALTGVPLATIHDESAFERALGEIRCHRDRMLEIEADTAERCVTYHPYRLSSTAQNFVSQLSTIVSFSGTPWNSDGYDPRLSERVKFDDGTEGKIVDALLDRAEKAQKAGIDVVHAVSSGDPGEVIRTLLKDHPRAERIRGFMDPGGVFKVDNIDVAQKFCDYLTSDKSSVPGIKGVLFFYRFSGQETADTLALLRRGDSTPIPIGGTRKEDLERAGIDPSEYFVYYDERHTTGTDIVQVPSAINFCTIDETMLRRSLLQSILRLRQFFFEQDVEFVIPEAVKHTLINGGETVHDIFVSSVRNQAIQRAKELYRSYKQMIDNVFRQQALKKMLSAEEDMVSTFRKYQQFLMVSTSDEPYRMFGALEQDIPTIDMLRRYSRGKLDELGKAGFAPTDREYIEIKCALDKLIQMASGKKDLLPERVPGIDAERIGLDQGVEVQQEAQQEQHAEEHLDQDLELELRKYEQNADIHSLYRESEWTDFEAGQFLQHFMPEIPIVRNDRSISLKDVLTSVAYEREYHAIFDQNIRATENFIHTFVKLFPVFHKAQRPAEQMLVVEGKDKTLSFIMVSDKEAAFFKDFLTRKYQEDNRYNAVWLVQSDGSPFVDNHKKPLLDSVDREVLERGLLQINVFNGNTFYLDMHADDTLVWFRENNAEIKRAFVRLKTARDPRRWAILTQSPALNPQKFAADEGRLGGRGARNAYMKFAIMNSEEIKAIRDLRLICYFRKEEVEICSPEQVPFLSGKQVTWLTTKEQVAALDSEETFHHLAIEQIKLISQKQVNWVEGIDKVANIPNEYVHYLSVETEKGQKKIRYLTPEQCAYISREQVPYVPLETQKIESVASVLVQFMDYNQCALISPKQIFEQQGENVIRRLSDAQIPFICGDAVQYIDDEKIQLLQSEEQIQKVKIPEKQSFLTSRQYAMLSPQQAVKLTDSTFVDDLLDVSLEAYIDRHGWDAISDRRIGAITLSTLASKVPNAQVHLLKNPSALKGLCAGQVPYINPTLAGCIDRPLWRHFSESALIFMTKNQISILDPVHEDERSVILRLRGKNVEHLESRALGVITGEQVGDLSIEQYKHLREESAIQRIAVKYFGYLANLPEVYGALSDNQLRSMSACSPSLARNIFTALKGRGSALIDIVSSEMVNNLPRELIEKIEDVDKIRALSDENLLFYVQKNGWPANLLEDTLENRSRFDRIRDKDLVKTVPQGTVAWLHNDMITSLKDEQIECIALEHVPYVKESQLHLLKKDALKHLTTSQLAVVTKEQVEDLSIEQYKHLREKSAIQAISVKDFDKLADSDDVYRMLSDDQIRAITSETTTPELARRIFGVWKNNPEIVGLVDISMGNYLPDELVQSWTDHLRIQALSDAKLRRRLQKGFITWSSVRDQRIELIRDKKLSTQVPQERQIYLTSERINIREPHRKRVGSVFDASIRNLTDSRQINALSARQIIFIDPLQYHLIKSKAMRAWYSVSTVASLLFSTLLCTTIIVPVVAIASRRWTMERNPFHDFWTWLRQWVHKGNV